MRSCLTTPRPPPPPLTLHQCNRLCGWTVGKEVTTMPTMAEHAKPVRSQNFQGSQERCYSFLQDAVSHSPSCPQLEAQESNANRLPTYLRLASHLNASIQELIKVITELSGSSCQLSTLASRGVDDFPSRLVQISSSLVQLALGFLERLCARR